MQFAQVHLVIIVLVGRVDVSFRFPIDNYTNAVISVLGSEHCKLKSLGLRPLFQYCDMTML